ncbi:hypothetical protein [Halarcobacter sp.]|uniref:hypothetical protein n=1 Tax=Halarcobacter sp. TaxID=2321133 RepID=UPI003A91E91B
MGLWAEIDDLIHSGMTKEEAIYYHTGENSLTIHEAVEKTLEEFNQEAEYLDIYEYIIENKLYFFGAEKEKPENILKRIIERKCINSNSSYKTKDLLFYKRDNKYGLLSWLNEEELTELSNEDIAIQRGIKISNEKQRLSSQIEKLEEALKKELEDKTNLKKESQQYEENFSKLKEEIEILKKEKIELLEYEKDIDKIRTAIKILKNPATQLIESKKSYLKDKEKFSKYADNLFIVSISFFVIVFTLILLSFGFDVFSKKTDWSLYLIIIFPIVFPALLSFLFTRQANIKSQEIEKINKRFILIHEVNQALDALVEINRGKAMDGKTEKIIDKLINNILEFSIDSKETKNDKVELNDISNKVDFIMKSIKNINS